MRILVFAAPLLLMLGTRGDCPACCAPPESPATKVGKGVVCTACDETAMQIGCQLDKAAALCAIVDPLKHCLKQHSSNEKQVIVPIRLSCPARECVVYFVPTRDLSS